MEEDDDDDDDDLLLINIISKGTLNEQCEIYIQQRVHSK